jgi:hypothetical protein
VDERVKWAAPVNMISGIMQGGSPCENAPNLRVGAFNVEFGAMMAPRPLLMVSATGDWTKNTPQEEFPAIRRIFDLYGQPQNVANVHIDAPHNYNQASREAMYRFFARQILGDPDEKKYAEKSIRVEPLQDMLALHNRTLPAGALDYDGLFRQWQAASKRQTDAASPDDLRLWLRYALGAEWPGEVYSDTRPGSGEMLLGRQGKGDRVPGLWIAGNQRAALVVHPEGARAARETPAVKELMKAESTLLLIDAFQTGAAVAPRNRSHRYFLTFNRSDDACRVQDILTALRVLEFKGYRGLRLMGLGKAAVWALFAAAVAPVEVQLAADPAGFEGRDEDFIERFFVPGLQRAGGLAAARKLARLGQ